MTRFLEYHPTQIQRIVDETRTTIYGLVFVSAVLVWTYGAFVPTYLLMIWIAAQSIYIVSRYFNAKALKRHLDNGDSDKMRLQARVLLLLIVFSALLWNLGNIIGVLYAPEWYEFISLIMMIGIVTVGALSLSALFFIYNVYFFLMMLPQFVLLSQYSDRLHHIIVILALIYFPIVFLLSRSVYRDFLITIDHHENLKSHATVMQRLSMTDALTQTHNRRYLYDTGRKLIEEALAEKQDVSQLMIDIDHFKKINDSYGHQVGDEILVSIAKNVQAVIRSGDILARVGGEEFAILLLNTPVQEAKNVAEAIRSSIEGVKFSHSSGDIIVTVSIGVAGLGGEALTLDRLYSEADARLYQAKSLGRNRVC